MKILVHSDPDLSGHEIHFLILSLKLSEAGARFAGESLIKTNSMFSKFDVNKNLS